MKCNQEVAGYKFVDYKILKRIINKGNGHEDLRKAQFKLTKESNENLTHELETSLEGYEELEGQYPNKVGSGIVDGGLIALRKLESVLNKLTGLDLA